MAAPTHTVFPRARIVAIGLIAVVVAAFAYIRFAPGPESISVPGGARAGDLFLHDCSYATEKGSYEADCGTLVVPENRAAAQSRLIALPVTRIRALSGQTAEPIFYLEGGPGITNTEFKYASRYADNHDVVLVGYRGVDGSVRLDCPEVESALRHSRDVLGEKSFRAYADGFRACAKRLTEDGVDLGAYGMAQQVDDMEAARVALGYDRIDLLSQSAGTRTALVYAWRYPDSIHRSVMIGVNPPGHFLWYPQATDEQIGRYADLCSNDAGCSRRTDDLAATLRQTAGDMPQRWLFLPIKEGNVRVASFMGLMESTSEASPFAAPRIIDGWLAAANGDASGLWAASVVSGLVLPTGFVWGQYASFGRPDVQAGHDYFSLYGTESVENLGSAATAFVWADGQLPDAWPAAPDEGEYSTVRTSEVETLLIGGSLDLSTPPQEATKELLPYLPNGRQVVLPGLGHTASFFAVQPEAGSRLINTFFDSGRVDDSLYTEQRVEFDVGVLSFPTIAKVLLSLMLGFALIAVLLLAWMAVRVGRHGSFGSKTSAVLRTLSPLPLGLGGWFLALLVVMVAWPEVFIGSQLLAVVSMGVPIGLGVYLAWVSRDGHHLGLVAAMVAAVIGAWLGSNVTGGLAAMLTTLLGAAVATNFALIVLDVVWDWSGKPAPIPMARGVGPQRPLNA